MIAGYLTFPTPSRQNLTGFSIACQSMMCCRNLVMVSQKMPRTDFRKIEYVGGIQINRGFARNV
jgi:hypothetical protein